MTRTSTVERVRRVVLAHGQLGIDDTDLADDANLYEYGMTSRASVTVMLELENEFELEFPEDMLRRDVFESVAAMSRAIQSLSASE